MPLRGVKRDIETVRIEVPLSEKKQKARILEWIPSKDGVNLADANVIVSGGRGIGKPENFALLQELADLLDGAVGASRAVVARCGRIGAVVARTRPRHEPRAETAVGAARLAGARPG